MLYIENRALLRCYITSCILCPETSARKLPILAGNNPEEHSSHLHRARRLKSYCYIIPSSSVLQFRPISLFHVQLFSPSIPRSPQWKAVCVFIFQHFPPRPPYGLHVLSTQSGKFLSLLTNVVVISCSPISLPLM